MNHQQLVSARFPKSRGSRIGTIAQVTDRSVIVTLQSNMMLKPVLKSDQWNFGTLVFFDDLKHIGIVDSSTYFYHAQVSAGTNRSQMNSFWRPKVYGFRQLPIPSASTAN